MGDNAKMTPALLTLCLQVEMTGITNEDELVIHVKRYNDAIKLKQENEKPLDLAYVLRRYRELKIRAEEESFYREHGCRECVYAHKMHKCFDRGMCIDDLLQEARNKANEKPKCPYDPEGTCGYANESGSCFGVCMKKILAERAEDNAAA